jgi:hypothetical protein
MIKIKNVDDNSRLHKITVPVVFVSASSLSAGYLGYGIVPAACYFEKLVVNSTIDATASNGTIVTMLNKALGTTLISATVHSQVSGEVDWSANSPKIVKPTAPIALSAGCPFSVQISGTVGVANISCYAQFDINDKLEK